MVIVMNEEIKISPRQIAKAINDLLEENEQLKERIDKASDNLKRNYWINEYEHNDDVINMTLKILKGDNNE